MIKLYLSPLVDCVDLGLVLWHPGRVDDWHGLDAQLRAGQGELDLGQGHLHGDVTILLQSLPNLVPVAPKGLKQVEEKEICSRVNDFIIFNLDVKCFSKKAT